MNNKKPQRKISLKELTSGFNAPLAAASINSTIRGTHASKNPITVNNASFVSLVMDDNGPAFTSMDCANEICSFNVDRSARIFSSGFVVDMLLLVDDDDVWEMLL